MKKSKKERSESEVPISSFATLNVVMEKAKANKKKLVKRKELPPPVPITESGSDSNKPQLKRTKKVIEPPVEPILNVELLTVAVVRKDVDQPVERPANQLVE